MPATGVVDSPRRRIRAVSARRRQRLWSQRASPRRHTTAPDTLEIKNHRHRPLSQQLPAPRVPRSPAFLSVRGPVRGSNTRSVRLSNSPGVRQRHRKCKRVAAKPPHERTRTHPPPTTGPERLPRPPRYARHDHGPLHLTSQQRSKGQDRGTLKHPRRHTPCAGGTSLAGRADLSSAGESCVVSAAVRPSSWSRSPADGRSAALRSPASSKRCPHQLAPMRRPAAGWGSCVGGRVQRAFLSVRGGCVA